MQQVELNLQTAVLATLATVMMIGLGFLRHPSRATRLWALAFLLAMLATFGQIAATVSEMELVRVACVGVILAGPPLIWSGVRAAFGKSSMAWIGLVLGASSAVLLVALAGSDGYILGFRLAFAASAVFAALTAAELIGSPQRGLGMLLPLTIISVIFPMLALANIVIALRAVVEGADDLTATQTVNVLGMPVYLVCAIVSLLYLASAAESDDGKRGARRLPRLTLADRLTRAQARNEATWSLLYINLDDVVDIRLAVGDAAFEQVIQRFTSDVRSAFPTEADIEFRSDTTALVLLTRPEATIRANVRSMLNAISSMDAEQPLSVQLAASVGWVTTATSGYDLDELVRVASAAAVDARLAGGDRWVRVGDATRAVR
ncbi:GGDEF domain-containing protein, diguanylate cyclase (c-di-GMP synthetase) or its enzymatically inactive variants [Microbacterium pygmaeum]|uniref:GGDEF domain-containing protein, diguanylate cyclase (C-di-GMP synthetase) or its enzymatically inactive variants n=1 Tax=Microbacterium pygmaeum TaxID=370764 RepID=A0A1G8E4K6_9MICO|nr:GGDEF domain-containing protein, diguanylate cyclase (c-di-GMP synthetase) or its enzymatically inactive variants [Microbacterium pygmaeum]SDH64886.1 GGDEF domain-containing protein, diguanylate cyclase (c-di-GMP synthetase) or its enzymatically inactive variants [Microbacterium pygmaeum]